MAYVLITTDNGVNKYKGNSIDTKPSSVPNGSRCFETDTRRVWVYDSSHKNPGTNTNWWPDYVDQEDFLDLLNDSVNDAQWGDMTNKTIQRKQTNLFKIPKVMAIPPTLSVLKSDTSGITSSQAIVAGIAGQTGINPMYKYYGEMYRSDYNRFTGVYGGTYPGYIYVANYAISGETGYSSGNLDVEFAVSSSDFEIMVQGNGQSTSYRILVDEGNGWELAFADPAATAIPNDAGKYQIRVTFTTRMLRRIRFQSANTKFAGVNIGANDTLCQLAHPIRPKAIFIGDSFTEGTGAIGFFNGYAPLVATILGFDYWVSGSGSTGFLATSAALHRVKYQDRIQHDVIGYNPDVIIVQGGQNDTAFAKADIQVAASTLFQTIKATLPKVPIICIGNIAIAQETTAITDTRDAIKAASLANGVAYVDSIAGITYDFSGNAINEALGEWFTGGGNTGAPQSTGNRSIFCWSDGGHPSNDGHRYIAERLSNIIYKLLY